MKKHLTLFLSFLLFFSCGNETLKSEDPNVIATEKAEENFTVNARSAYNFDELTNTAIGYDNNGVVELGVSKQKVMETFIMFSMLHNEELKPKSFEIITIDDFHYLRFYSEDDIVSTIALIKNDNDQYITGRTVCETKRCADGGGCIPNGDYCTPCVRNDVPGDCKRTTISEP
ncbi:hypothetical protein [Gelidibacter pelagius]|uniref:Lipoprotein n=1 Tax=Gelidibacter pelagius TaxID=2819985 RepID=A0ABS3SN89_9FLAO|nr:hypothetical protein [Gelidibacter pelagius]MBO3097099.1 hypothetical protein [Gelidibacter pelagius]